MTAEEILKGAGAPITKDIADRLAEYNDLVMDATKKMNITALRRADESLIKNVYDSLTVYHAPFFPEGGRLLDLGTGAGFPGVPLAILRPDMKVFLMDSIEKKLRFIEEAAGQMKITNVTCLHVRAEEAGKRRKMRETFDVVTARAVKALPVVAEWALPLVKVGGVFAAMKGPRVWDELADSGKIIALLGGKVEGKKKLTLPTGENRIILYIRKEKPSPKSYPRKIGFAERNPIIGPAPKE